MSATNYPAADVARSLLAGRTLRRDEARALIAAVMDDQMAPAMLGAVLALLAARGETVDELVGAAEALRERLAEVAAPPGVEAIDTCGTGGDGRPTFNVSTAATIVAAAAGATVAKHGNRSHARPSGSAEALTALGVNVEAAPAVLERCLRECRVAFLFAVRQHPAMRHAAAVRKALGFRTIFNLVGPLANPARVRRQFLGVPRVELVERMVAALRELGTTRAMVVCGREGLCDLSIAGPSVVARLDGGVVRLEEVEPAAIGATAAPLDSILVDGPQASAAMIRAVLSGRPGPARDIVVFNAAGALWVAGVAEDWSGGARLAREVIDNGAAAALLDRWVQLSNAPA